MGEKYLRGELMNKYIELNNITKRFNGQTIFENINMNIEKGKTVGLIGGNGSGKSVLFKIVCGMVKPDQGTVTINGIQLGDKIDFPQNVGVFINSPGFIGIYSGFKNLKFLADIKNEISDGQICDAMIKVGLDPNNKNKVDNYSLGMKQKLGLAQAIMENQEILVLDEPFNSLDFQTYNDVKEIIQSLQSEAKTILLTSHNYADIEQLCDEVYIIENHKVIPLEERHLEMFRR